MKKFIKFFVIVASLILVATSLPKLYTKAAPVEPTLVPDNPSCISLGYSREFKVETMSSGTYTFDGTQSVTLVVDGKYFDWSSTLGIDAVIVKGGPNANLYVYDPPSESLGDTQLHAPKFKSQPYGLSHISFCYDYNLSVTKSAKTYYTRTWNWDITKVAKPASWNLFVGDSAVTDYEVTIKKTGYIDSGWKVGGGITIHNSTPYNATITDVVDTLNGVAYPAVVDCHVAYPYLLLAGAYLNCAYSIDLPNAENHTNTVEVITSGDVDGNTATAPVDFSMATVDSKNSTVTAKDGDKTEVFIDSGVWSYKGVKYECSEVKTGDKVTNTAYIVELPEKTASADVTYNCYDLAVSKTATPSFERSYDWDITKSVTPSSWDLFNGDTGQSLYTVKVDKKDLVESKFKVVGEITISNSAPIDAIINSVSDIANAESATVNCNVSFPYTLAKGGTLVCAYSADLPSKTGGTNTATAVQQNYDYTTSGSTADGTKDYTGTKDYSFEGLNPEATNNSIDVVDTNGGSWVFSADGSVSYEKTFVCGADKGVHENTATITQTGQSSSASVAVNCYELTVSKDATTSYDRDWDWTIDKSADQSSIAELAIGQEATVNYTVNVSAVKTDSNAKVSGNIVVNNPAPMAATLTEVADKVSGVAASVDCPSYVVPASGTLSCTYNLDLTDTTSKLNTATVTQQNYAYLLEATTLAGSKDYQANADVLFGAPTNEYDEKINVVDDKYGDLGLVLASESSKTFTYSHVFNYSVCGDYNYPNIASFITNDTKTFGSDNWNVDIHVPCVDLGCTLTPGYWKTHSKYGPASYNDTWGLLMPDGEDSPFYLSNQTYYQVLWTDPSINPYYSLAHAYIASQLNILAGASMSADVKVAFDEATLLFSTNTPEDIAGAKGKLKAQFINAYKILDAYNNGLSGTPYCSVVI